MCASARSRSGAAERGEQLLDGRRDPRVQQDRDHAQPFGERHEHAIELVGAGVVAREHPRRLLLDVAVQAAHAQPDRIERAAEVGAVEQLGDLGDERVDLGDEIGVGRRRSGTAPPR